MTENKRFRVMKYIENCDVASDVIDSYVEKLIKEGKSVDWVSIGITDNGKNMTYKECVDLLNQLNDENEQLKQQLKEPYFWYKEYKKLLNENEQLKQSYQRVFDLIDEKICECDIRECDCCRNCIADQLLNELKKELQE